MTRNHSKTLKAWNISLWIAQVLLAAMFIMVGLMKTITPIEELAKMNPLSRDIPNLIRFIGISELAGGLGLLLPAALRIKPKLTVYAAGSLAFVMLLALIFHAWRGEYAATITNIVIGMLACFVVWGRSTKAPIASRFHNNTFAKT